MLLILPKQLIKLTKTQKQNKLNTKSLTVNFFYTTAEKLIQTNLAIKPDIMKS